VASTDTTYEEVKAYLSGTCSKDAHELRAEGARHGDGLVISMRDGQDVADEYRGAMLWWSSLVVVEPQGSGHYRIRPLHRVSRTLGEACKHSAKSLPSVALGKEHPAKNLSAKSSLPSALFRTIGKGLAECLFHTWQRPV
jgi:hypothetical protein